MDKANLYAPITKVDAGTRTVTGYATTGGLDLDGQRCDPKWLKSAIPEWMTWGNIREMHSPSAVGTAKSAELDDKGAFIKAKVVDDDAWKKVEEGVYKGFSIGIKGPILRKSADAPNGVIAGGIICEVSLVDRPANPECVLSVAKAAGETFKQDIQQEQVSWKTVGVWQASDGAELVKAEWSQAYIDDLPDSAFAYVESGGTKKNGKTHPLSKRHLPYKDKSGNIDKPHLRNALARLDQTHIGSGAKAKAKARLLRAARKVGIDVSDEEQKFADDVLEAVAKSLDMTKSEFTDAMSRMRDIASSTGDDDDGDIDDANNPENDMDEMKAVEPDVEKMGGLLTPDELKAAIGDAVKGAVEPINERLEKVENMAAPAKAAKAADKSFAANGGEQTPDGMMGVLQKAAHDMSEEEQIDLVKQLVQNGQYGGGN